MRARNLKPAFFKNADLIELPIHVRLLFAGLWCMADREGRLKDRPKQIRMEIFPADDVDVDASLADLARTGFISRYQIGEGKYIQVINFKKHQNPHRREAPSEIPPPPRMGADPDTDGLGSGLATDQSGPASDVRPTKTGKTRSRRGKEPETLPDGFSEFWAAYPRRDAKEKAIKAWVSLAPDSDLRARIIADVARRAADPEWKKEDGKYILFPATYLNGRRWEDEGVKLGTAGTNGKPHCEEPETIRFARHRAQERAGARP